MSDKKNEPAPRQWLCGNCGCGNKPDHEQCSMCSVPRSYTRKPPDKKKAGQR